MQVDGRCLLVFLIPLFVYLVGVMKFDVRSNNFIYDGFVPTDVYEFL